MAGKGPVGADADVPPPDSELLRAMREHELVTLFMMARLNYEGFRPYEVRSIYLKYVAYWHRALAARRPSAVVFLVTPHMGFDYVLYALCKLLGVRTLVIERTFISDRLVMLEGIHDIPAPPAAIFDDDLSPRLEVAEVTPLRSDVRSYYEVRDRRFVTPDPAPTRAALMRAVMKHAFRSVRQQLAQLPSLHLQHRDSIYVLSYALRGRTPSKAAHAWHSLRDGIAMEHVRWRYQRAACQPDFSQDYVYFSLNYQPEKSTIPLAGDFADQISALDLLVDALPQGWTIYVKEHPRQFWDPSRFRLARGHRFYRALQRHGDKVQLVPTSVPSGDLIAHARCVATPTGSAGWEAVNAGVPALVFGTPWYMHCPGVRSLSSRRDCHEALADVASGRLAVVPRALVRYREWLVSSATFAGYFEDTFEPMSALSPQANAESFATAIASRLALESTHV